MPAERPWDQNEHFTAVTREKARELMRSYAAGVQPWGPLDVIGPVGLTRGVKRESYWQYLDWLGTAQPMPFCWHEAAG